MNPDVAAAALDADAARAPRRLRRAPGTIPKVKIELTSPRDDFGSLSQETYQIRQMLPLWGQTALKREIADWEASKATASVRDVENQIAYRVKAAYAEYHSAHLALEETKKLVAHIRPSDRPSPAPRYAENAASLADVTGAKSETGALEADIARLSAEKSAATARLKPTARAQRRHTACRPSVAARGTTADGNQDGGPGWSRQRGLASGSNGACRNGSRQERTAPRRAQFSCPASNSVSAPCAKTTGSMGAEVMVEFSVPLQWSAKRAEQREAAAKAAAAARQGSMPCGSTNDNRYPLGPLRPHGARYAAQGHRPAPTLPQARIALDASNKAYAPRQSRLSGCSPPPEQALRRALVDSIEATFKEQLALCRNRAHRRRGFSDDEITFHGRPLPRWRFSPPPVCRSPSMPWHSPATQGMAPPRRQCPPQPSPLPPGPAPIAAAPGARRVLYYRNAHGPAPTPRRCPKKGCHGHGLRAGLCRTRILPAPLPLVPTRSRHSVFERKRQPSGP